MFRVPKTRGNESNVTGTRLRHDTNAGEQKLWFFFAICRALHSVGNLNMRSNPGCTKGIEVQSAKTNSNTPKVVVVAVMSQGQSSLSFLKSSVRHNARGKKLLVSGKERAGIVVK